MKNARFACALLAIGAACSAWAAEDVDAMFRRLKGPDGKVHLTKAQLAELLQQNAAAPGKSPGASAPDSLLKEFQAMDEAPSDGALTRAQFRKEIESGRLSSPSSQSEDELIRRLFPANNNFLR